MLWGKKFNWILNILSLQKPPQGKIVFVFSSTISVYVDTRALIARLPCFTQCYTEDILRHFQDVLVLEILQQNVITVQPFVLSCNFCKKIKNFNPITHYFHSLQVSHNNSNATDLYVMFVFNQGYLALYFPNYFVLVPLAQYQQYKKAINHFWLQVINNMLRFRLSCWSVNTVDLLH